MQKNIYSLMITLFAICCSSAMAQGQVAFRNANSKLVNVNAHSGVAVTICDWNGDGLDDIIHLEGGHNCYVEVQTTNAQFERVGLGDFGAGNSAWAMTVADVDHNGYLDVIADGNSGIGLLKTDNTGTGATMSWLTNSGFFLQNATFGDFNNDGWVDLFCCDDNAAAHVYMNDGAGNLNTSTYINFDINGNLTYGGDPYDSGNYGSAWIDFDNDGDLDLYIAHCRQSTNSTTDQRRRDRLFVNDGTYHFTEDAASYGIETTVYNQTWTGSFGDIDNDGDLDLVVTNHDVPSQIFQNDGTGHYTDITASTGYIVDISSPLESVLEDFNNDGWLDILVTGDDSRFFLNNGNGTFTRVDNLFDNNQMESFAIGDLNHDGSVDIYSSYATIYTNPTNINDVIWMSKKNNNHFITFNLKGTISNHNAIGARVTLYSSLGTQIREVRSGESYGTCNSFECHFGTGALTAVDSAVIRFTSGITQTIINPMVDQFITVIEGDCVSPSAMLTANGPLAICPGSGATLVVTASTGYSYMWSDGSTAQSLTITQVGEYNVMITQAGNNCVATSPTMDIESNPDNTPSIYAAGITEFCPGSSVQLTGPAGQLSYTWSDGSTTQNITASATGNYTLTVPGVCQSFTSTPIAVTVHTPLVSSTQNGLACINGSATLSAIGTSTIDWYDAAMGGNLLYSGNPFITPVITATTDFYAEDRFGVSQAFMQPYDNSIGTGVYSTNNSRYLMFNVAQPMVLVSVRVFASTAGNRTIELRDYADAVLQAATVNVPVGDSHVTLNFTIPAGTNYHLGLNGVSAVDLFRNDGGVSYPYNVSNLVSITGSSAGANYYYFFYDWEVRQTNPVCTSARVVATAGIDPGCTAGVAEHANNDLLNIFPNPASNFITIDLKYATHEKVEVRINDLAGKTVQTSSFENATGTVKQNIDMSNLAKGFYMINIKAGSQQWERKITLQ